MSVIKNLKIFSLIFALAGCGSANLETPDGISEDQEGIWAFDTWGDDCSNEVSEHPCNFTLLDQNGEESNLYDFYGSPIVLGFSAMWCGPCQYAALEVEDMKIDFPSITYITVLIDNEYGDPPTVEDLDKWATIFGITEPVLGGSREMISTNPGFGWNIVSWPTFYYINEKMIIEHSHKGYSSVTVRQNIENLVR